MLVTLSRVMHLTALIFYQIKSFNAVTISTKLTDKCCGMHIICIYCNHCTHARFWPCFHVISGGYYQNNWYFCPPLLFSQVQEKISSFHPFFHLLSYQTYNINSLIPTVQYHVFGLVFMWYNVISEKKNCFKKSAKVWIFKLKKAFS